MFDPDKQANQKIEYDENWYTVLAWDLGYGDENVILVICRDANGRFGIIDSFVMREQLIRFYIDLVHGFKPRELDTLPFDERRKTELFLTRARERDYKRKIQVLGPDARARGIRSRKSVKDEMITAHMLGRNYVDLQVRVVDTGVLDGIGMVSRIMDPALDMFSVDAEQTEVIERIMNYRRKRDMDGNYIDEPVHDWASHVPDAIRYGFDFMTRQEGRIIGRKPRRA
jgi:hypothetical protein